MSGMMGESPEGTAKPAEQRASRHSTESACSAGRSDSSSRVRSIAARAAAALAGAR
jgi:hypothetical protein